MHAINHTCADRSPRSASPRHAALALLVCGLAAAAGPCAAYPIDGYADTGMRRVEGVRLIQEGLMDGDKQPAGALLPTAAVDLRLTDHPALALPAPDPQFSRAVLALLGENADRYGIAVLDLSDPARPRYAEHRADHLQNVGSVGKLVVALGLFQALADVWPDDVQARARVLHETTVTADAFIRTDHHSVRLVDVAARRLDKRPLAEGDTGNLWEWLDWMLSASSNAAAATLQKEALLLAHFGRRYPVSTAEANRFLEETPRGEITALYARTFDDALTRNGFDITRIRQGSLFTREGKRRVSGSGSSYGSARQFVLFLLAMEQGRLVDEWSSRQIKRLLYMTERRIRYASSPALRDAAVYFKSGSLYQCQAEEGFTCKKYHGNVKNYMNSVAIVESPAGEHRHVYLVSLISNVLRKNSAVDHQTLATRIHRLIEAGPGAAGEPEAQATGESAGGETPGDEPSVGEDDATPAQGSSD